jgi:hypothetical protein
MKGEELSNKEIIRKVRQYTSGSKLFTIIHIQQLDNNDICM